MTKLERKLIDRLNFLCKRVPGVQPIQDLERIALIVDDVGFEEDGDLLRRLADRLRELRSAVRGQSRADLDRSQTRRRLADSTPEEGRPFG